MKSPYIRANIQVIVSSIIYGFAGIFFAYIKDMASGTVVFYQILLGFLVLAAYLALKGELSGLRLKEKRKGLFLLGVWQAGVLLSYYEAIRYTNVSISVLLLYTAPVYVTLLAPFLLKEKLTLRNLAALLISLAGVLVVVGPDALFSGEGKGYLLGVLLGLFSGFFYACIIMTSRYLRDEYTGLEQLFLSTAVTLLLLLPYALKSPVAAVFENLPVILFMGIMITSVGSILYFTGLMHVKAQNASIISLLEPVSAILCAYVLLKDPISSGTLAGCFLILSSSLLVSFEDDTEAGQKGPEGPKHRKIPENSENSENETEANFDRLEAF